MDPYASCERDPAAAKGTQESSDPLDVLSLCGPVGSGKAALWCVRVSE